MRQQETTGQLDRATLYDLALRHRGDPGGFQAEVQKLTGEADVFAPIRPSIGERVVGAAGSAVSGAAQAVTAPIEFAGIALKGAERLFGGEGGEGDLLARYGQEAQQWIDRGLGSSNPIVRDAFATKLANAVGQGAGMMAGAAGLARAGGEATLKVGARLGLRGAALEALPAYAAIATQGAMAQGVSQYYDALASGADEPASWKAFLLGMGVGTTEAVPLAGILGRINEGTGGGLRKALVHMVLEGGEEFGQETGQQMLSNVIAQNLYDKDRRVMEGVAQSGQLGGFAGVVLSALGSAAGGAVAAHRGREGATEPAAAGAEARPQAGPQVREGAQAAPEQRAAAPAQRLPNEPEPIGPAPKPSEEARATASEYLANQGEGVVGEVVGPQTEAQQRVAAYFKERGGEAVFVKSDQPLEKPAMYRRGVAVFDASVPDEQLEKRLAQHEASHHLLEVFRQDLEPHLRAPDEVNPWLKISQAIERVDRPGVEAVRRQVEADYAQVFARQGLEGPALEEAVREETVANYLEGSGGLLFEADNLRRAMAEPTLGRRIVEAVIRLLNKVGVRIAPRLQRRLRDARRLLRETPLERGLSEGQALELSGIVTEAMNSLVGYRRPPKAQVEAVAPTATEAEPTGPIPTRSIPRAPPPPLVTLAPQVPRGTFATPVQPAPIPEQGALTGAQAKRARQKRNRMEARARGLEKAGKTEEAQAVRSEIEGLVRPPRPEVRRREEPSRQQLAIEAYEGGEERPGMFAAGGAARDPVEIAREIEAKHPGLTLEVSARSARDPYGRTIWNLDSIVVPKAERGRGVGSAAMEELVREADRAGATIALSPSTDFGATSVARLRRFYSRFGFRRNLGARADSSITGAMIRPPQAPPRFAVARTDTPEFRAWFGESKVVDEQGQPKVVYHGSGRPDRIGSMFRRSRATSGPMPFFTASPEIASNYAQQKVDTSLEHPESYAGWFLFTPRGARASVDIERAWYHLSPSERAQISERLPHIRYVDEENYSKGFVYDPSDYGLTSKGHWDYVVREARGNMLAAGVETWLSSAQLLDDPSEFLDILRLAGMPMDRISFNDPHATYPAVLPVYLSIQRPLEAANITSAEVEQLQRAANRTRATPQPYADIWDKRARDPQGWMQELRENPDTAWTTIPDWVTRELQRMGYDGIKDTGGKLGGLEHEVWIPFRETQVKSATGNRGTFDPFSKNVRFALRPPDALGFRSALEDAAEEKLPARATPEQILRTLANTPGVKGEEIDYSGLRDFLKGRATFTKQEVQEYLQANNVRVEEKALGTRRPLTKEENARYQMLTDLRIREGIDGLTPEEQQEYNRLNALYQEGTDAKYGQYVLPGGQNYRELLLTLPDKGLLDLGTPTTVRVGELGYEVFNQRGEPYGLYNAASPEAALDHARRVGPTNFGLDAARAAGRPPEGFTGGHFSDIARNVLAHARVTDRTTADGKRILFAEEIQSDWHQKGKREGYAGGADARAALEQHERETNELAREIAERYGFGRPPEVGPLAAKTVLGKLLAKINEFNTTTPEGMQWWNDQQALNRAIDEDARLAQAARNAERAVPDAPFKKTWPDLVLKRLIRYAAEHGYDGVGWTTGEQQAERYDLSKHIDKLVYEIPPSEPGALRTSYILTATAKDGSAINLGSHEPGELADVVGKDVADRILKGEGFKSGQFERVLKDVDLRVGGEGMRGFYDDLLVKSANKLGKQHGAVVAEKTITGTGRTQSERSAENELDYALLNAGLARRELEWVSNNWDRGGRDRAMALDPEAVTRYEAARVEATGSRVHVLPVTPALRTSAMERGLPRFAAGQTGEPSPEDVARIKELRDEARAEPISTERAIPTKDEEKRALWKGLDAWRDENGQPKHIPIAAQWEQADKELRSAPKATEVRVRQKLDLALPLEPWENVAAARIVHRQMNAGIYGQNEAALIDAMALADKLRENRGNIARALGVLHDAYRSPAEELAEAIAAPSRRGRENIAAIKEIIKSPTASAHEKAVAEKRLKAVMVNEAKQTKKVYEKLVKTGLDPFRLSPAQLADPDVAQAIRSAAFPLKEATWGDKIHELRIANMVSALGSHAANTKGNAAMIAVEQHAKRFAEAMVNTALGAVGQQRPDAATIGETVAFYQAFFLSFRKAWANALASFRTEQPGYEADLLRRGVSLEDFGLREESMRHGAIQGKVGRVVRLSLRALTAEDAFFKTMAGLPELHALAYRKAKQEGLSGDALARRQYEIVSDASDPIQQKAVRESLRLTFQEPATGKGADQLLAIAQKIRHGLDEFGADVLEKVSGGYLADQRRLDILGRGLVPFLNTAFRIFQRGLGLPLAPAVQAGKVVKSAVRGEGYLSSGDFVSDTGRSLVALGLIYFVSELMHLRDDEDRPYLTGSGGEYNAAKRSLEYRMGARPHQIYIPFTGTYHDYSRIEPLATIFDTTSDAINAWQNRDDVSPLLAVAKSIFEQSTDKTFLRTWGDLIDALRRPEGSSAASLTRDVLVMPFVPNAIRELGRETSPEMREGRIRKKGDEGVWEAAARSIPFDVFPSSANPAAPPLRYDLWGRDMTRFDPNRSRLGRYAQNLVLRDVDIGPIDKVDRLIWDYNARVERGELGDDAAPFYPGPPSSYATKNGERADWTDEEYSYLQREAGQRAATALERMALSFGAPTDRDIDIIKREIARARTTVRDELFARRRGQVPQLTRR